MPKMEQEMPQLDLYQTISIALQYSALTILLFCDEDLKEFVKDAFVTLIGNKQTMLLHKAVKCRNLIAIKALIEMGVSINAKDNEGYTALTLAIKLQFKEAIDIFEYILFNK